MARYLGQAFGHKVVVLRAGDNTRYKRLLASVAPMSDQVDGYASAPLFILSHIALLWKLPGLIFRLRRLRPDLVIVNMPGLEFGWLYLYASKLLRIPVLCWLHNPYRYAELSQAWGWRRRVNIVRDSLANRFVNLLYEDLYTVSEASRAHLLARLGRDEGVGLLRNVVEDQESNSAAAVDLRSLPGCTVPASYTLAVVPGRIEFGHKGQDRIASALPRFETEGIAVFFVGDGPDAARLEQLCAGAGNAFFLGWQDQLASYIAAADVVLIPSRFDSQGLVLVEAIHAGIPAVVSSIPAFSQVLDARFQADFDDAADVVGAVRRVKLLTKIQLRQAYERALHESGASGYAEHVASVLSRAISPAGDPKPPT